MAGVHRHNKIKREPDDGVSSTSKAPYLQMFSQTFQDLSDVEFAIDGELLPAHSQYLASHSKLLQDLLQDAHTFNTQQPLVLKQEELNISKRELLGFLRQVYTNLPLDSIPGAFRLLKAADFFNAPTLTDKAVSFLESFSVPPIDRQIFALSALKWLPRAQPYPSLPNFRKTCADAIVDEYRFVRQQEDFAELNSAALTLVADALHAKLTSRNPAGFPVQRTAF